MGKESKIPHFFALATCRAVSFGLAWICLDVCRELGLLKYVKRPEYYTNIRYEYKTQIWNQNIRYKRKRPEYHTIVVS